MTTARHWKKFPERRRRIRLLTLKNTAWFLGGLFVLFIAYSSYNELRSGNGSRARLSEQGDTAPVTTPVPKTVEVIEEGRQSSRDSSLATPTFAEPERRLPVYVPPPEKPIPTLKETRQRGGRTVITGGAEGLRVEERPRKK